MASRRQAGAPRRETRAVLALATAALFAFAGVPAHADDWTGAQSSGWYDGRHWSNGTMLTDGTQDTSDVFADADYQAGDGFKSASFGAGLRLRW